MYKPLFLLMALFVGTAFAADGVVASRTIPSNLTSDAGDGDATARATSRTTVSRTKATSTTKDSSSRGVSSESRTTASRSTTTRTDSASSRGTTTRTADSTKNTVSRSTVGDINSNPVVRRAGVVLRPSFADYGGRATIAGTDRQTGSNISTDIQKLSNRATKNVQATKESIADAREKLELTAELNKSCQEQYNECMDQFCAIVDANQKRCSCSSNLSRYTKVEKAVTEANSKLNEVAQAIRYVGLSADEIRAIMTETEAEEALDDTKDTSTTRNMLKQIESMIKDPTSSTTSYSSDTTFGFGLDMDLTFSSDPIDIFNLDFLNTNMNSSSISKLRGTELYNTAKKRCNTILTQCKDAGATQAQITGNYDLAIDKDCIEYEAGLKKMNDTLLSNVKSANLMLQKARLAVMENKNQYDARGCVGALEACMKDDMVCGDDYYKCVDPTKAYIDENGDVVLGQDITVIQSFMTDYNNAAIDKDFLANAYGTKIGANSCMGDGKCVVKYLLQKIGTKDKATAEGLCRPVLDKCQLYTYDSKTSKYNAYNDIVVNYIQRAMVSIKAAQQKIISDYASTCIMDVATCYNQQVTQVNSWATAASASNIYSVMRGACRSVALTCGLAIFTGDPKIDPNTELVVDGKTYSVSGCQGAAGQRYGSSTYNDEIISCISNMFYQSLLCPDNSSFQSTENTSTDPNDTKAGWVNTRCKCNDGYTVWGGACVVDCGAGQLRNTNGTCWCSDATYTELRNGVCYEPNTNNAHPDSYVTPTSSSGSSSNRYTVKFSCGSGGNGNSTDIPVTAGNTVTLPQGSKCTANLGKQFSKWSCAGTLYDAGALYTPETTTTTCTAQWTDIATYTVNFGCGEGGSGSPTSQRINAGGSITLPSSGVCGSSTGQRFNKWLCDNREYNAGSSFTPSATTTCTATWTDSGNSGSSSGGGTTTTTYVVNFDCGDYGNETLADLTTTQGSYVTLYGSNVCTSNNSSKVFNMWNCDGSLRGAGGSYYPSTTPTRCSATWKDATQTIYTINFACRSNGTGNSWSQQVSENGSITLPDGNNCTANSGETFNKWSCNGTERDAGSSFTPSTITTNCTATWTNSGSGGGGETAQQMMQATVADLNSDTPSLEAQILSSTPSYSLVGTADLCWLYNTTGTEPKPVGAVSCDINLNNL
ncbi:MAG: hypothetical protein J6W40_01550 [Alphaproteobacteria bacterium]|nr:hypothetical protein [Alphaproteobacteria bacterium]